VNRGKLSQRSLVEDERYIRRDWKPLHDKRAHRLTRAQISDRFDEITKEKGAVTANRARSTLSAMFAWAMTKGKAETNPVAGTAKHEEGSRDRVLNGGELGAVWGACGNDDYSHIVKLLILTGARRDEIASIRNSELQRDLRMWSLPAERTKNGLPHDVPLSGAALTELPPARDGRDLLFGHASGPFSGWSRCKERLDARIAKASPDGKPLPDWTLHDLRRTTATGMAEIGVQPHIVEAVLNHISGVRRGVAGIYNRAVYADEKRAALDKWAARIAQLVSGQAGNVVALQPASGR
jgi:integrase